MLNNFFRKLHRLWHNSEKYGGYRGATRDVTIWRIRVTCWIGMVTCTYSHAHAHTVGYQHARTHRAISNTYCFSMATMIRELASMLLYTYIACLDLLNNAVLFLVLEVFAPCATWIYQRRLGNSCGPQLHSVFRNVVGKFTSQKTKTATFTSRLKSKIKTNNALFSSRIETGSWEM